MGFREEQVRKEQQGADSSSWQVTTGEAVSVSGCALLLVLVKKGKEQARG
jgi:hypothetical protein